MKKILVIEDDSSLLELIALSLKYKLYEVYKANNGQIGLELAENIKPDLIICDIMMPGITGYEVYGILHQKNLINKTPFIFISAMSDRESIRKGMELGVDDYITKPFKIEELLKAVKTRLDKAELRRCKQDITDETIGDHHVNNHILLTINNQPKLLNIDSITHIDGNREYSYVNLMSGERLLVRKIIKEWTDILPFNSFIRIHKSTIININYISNIEKNTNSSFSIFIKNKREPFISSRRMTSKLRSRFQVT